MSAPRPHILIVDADQRAAQVTSAIVSRALPAAQLTIALTPNAAWSSVQRLWPDVLIIDPATTSTATRLIQQARQSPHPLRVIILTSAASASLRQRMALLGADVYLDKSFPPNLLIGWLKHSLRI